VSGLAWSNIVVWGTAWHITLVLVAHVIHDAFLMLVNIIIIITIGTVVAARGVEEIADDGLF
jgi:hypothetical protein